MSSVPAMRYKAGIREDLCVRPSDSRRQLNSPSLSYIEPGSCTSGGDHKRSAIAALRGQILESMFSGVTHSDHMQASPPRMRLFSSGFSEAAAPLIGSTA